MKVNNSAYSPSWSDHQKENTLEFRFLHPCLYLLEVHGCRLLHFLLLSRFSLHCLMLWDNSYWEMTETCTTVQSSEITQDKTFLQIITFCKGRTSMRWLLIMLCWLSLQLLTHQYHSHSRMYLCKGGFTLFFDECIAEGLTLGTTCISSETRGGRFQHSPPWTMGLPVSFL